MHARSVLAHTLIPICVHVCASPSVIGIAWEVVGNENDRSEYDKGGADAIRDWWISAGDVRLPWRPEPAPAAVRISRDVRLPLELRSPTKPGEQPNLYRILGIENEAKSANLQTIEAAHDRLVIQINKWIRFDTNDFRYRVTEVSAAKDVLSDPILRAAYDEFGFSGIQHYWWQHVPAVDDKSWKKASPPPLLGQPAVAIDPESFMADGSFDSASTDPIPVDPNPSNELPPHGFKFDPYALLGVKFTASEQEIRTAFQSLTAA